MKLQPGLVELVVSDMASTLAFYRRLGLDIPADADDQPHVDIHLDGGMRLAFDTEETIRSFDPEWSPPSGGHRMALAFACESPDQPVTQNSARPAASKRVIERCRRTHSWRAKKAAMPAPPPTAR